MKEHVVNDLNNFICGWYLADTSICDKLIQYHEASDNKFMGKTKGIVNLEVKDSIDVVLNDDPLAYEYFFNHLLPVTELYKKRYPYCNTAAEWGVIECIKLQHYLPNGGFKVWHTERSDTEPYSKRHLVFMTYLNDVTDGGETEFFHQNLKITPEKGLTLIWGADWTFTHRGIPSPSQEKYIATGWFSFL